MICDECHSDCKACTGGLNTECSACTENDRYFAPITLTVGRCYPASKCPFRTYPNNGTKTAPVRECSTYHIDCLECTDSGDSNYISCPTAKKFLYNGKCHTACPEHTKANTANNTCSNKSFGGYLFSGIAILIALSYFSFNIFFHPHLLLFIFLQFSSPS